MRTQSHIFSPWASQGRAPWTSARDHSPETVALLSGSTAVHGLIDLLLNDTAGVGFDEPRQLTGGRDPSDVPLILAPVAFDGATLHRPHVKVRSETEW